MTFIVKLNTYNQQFLTEFKQEFYYFIPIFEHRSNLVTTLFSKQEDLTTSMMNFLIDLNILQHMRMISWIQVRPNARLNIHKDGASWDWTLVIPLQNYQNTFAESYISTSEPTFVHTPDCEYYTYTSQDCTLNESMEFDNPIFMYTEVPHTIYNSTSEFAYYVSFRLDKTFQL